MKKEDIKIVIGAIIVIIGFFVGILSIPFNYSGPIVANVLGLSLVIGLTLMLSSLKA